MTIVALLAWVTVIWTISSTPGFDNEEARRNIQSTGGVVFGVIMHNAYTAESVRWSRRANESFEDLFNNGILRPVVEAPNFDGVKQAIEKTGELFPRYAVVIYENDSKDRTVDKMQSWASRNKRVHFQTEKLNRKKAFDSIARTEWLAQYRNKLLDVVLSSDYDWADYVVLFDQDIQPWSVEAVLSTFATQSDNAGHKVPFDQWDKICGNRVETTGSLSDLYAFRDSRWPGHWDRGNIPAMRDYCYWPFDSPLVPVQACFGSWAIYRRDALQGCRYAGHDELNRTECEHVVLDRCMSEHGHSQQYLSPKVVVHTAGINGFLYPFLQTLGVNDIAHGRNVALKFMQALVLCVAGLVGMTASWLLIACIAHKLDTTHRYAVLEQAEGNANGDVSENSEEEEDSEADDKQV